MRYPIELELTDFCGLQCKYCPNHTFKDKGFLKFSDFNLILDYLYFNKDNILFLDLSGIGDVFLHPEIEKILILLSEKFSKTGFEILIPTKGNSLSDKHIDILKKCYLDGLKINLSIGVYSIRANIHDSISGVKNFHRVILSIKKLKLNNIPFTLELLINNYSVEEISYFKKFSEKIGVNFKIHNYHNFGGVIKDEKFVNYNSKNYKLNCSFADEEVFDYSFHCKYTMPFISREGYLYSCTHGGKQEKFKLEKIDKLFKKYSNYIDLLNYININTNISICNNCTYMKNIN